MNIRKIIPVLIFPVIIVAFLLLPIRAGQKAQKRHVENMAGQKLVQKLCLYCHSNAAISQKKVRPWDQLTLESSQKDFHKSITEGVKPVMPGFFELTEDQTADIYAYLKHEAVPLDPKGTVSKKTKTSSPYKVSSEISQSKIEEKLSAELRCPCCGQLIKDCSCGMIPKIRGQIRILEQRGFEEEKIKEVLVKNYGKKILPIFEITETLSPEPFEKIASAYKTAEQIPHILEKIGCFCPCYNQGHTSLLDCYKDKHASQCQICMDEALTAQHLSEQGLAEDDIVQTVHEKYRPKIKKSDRKKP